MNTKKRSFIKDSDTRSNPKKQWKVYKNLTDPQTTPNALVVQTRSWGLHSTNCTHSTNMRPSQRREKPLIDLYDSTKRSITCCHMIAHQEFIPSPINPTTVNFVKTMIQSILMIDPNKIKYILKPLFHRENTKLFKT